MYLEEVDSFPSSNFYCFSIYTPYLMLKEPELLDNVLPGNNITLNYRFSVRHGMTKSIEFDVSTTTGSCTFHRVDICS